LNISSSTNAREPKKNRRRLGRKPTRDDFHVVTLDPNMFDVKKQQRLYIGNLETFRPFVELRNRSLVMAPRLYCDPISKILTGSYSACPPDIKAFLYFFTYPKKPLIAGELRLRVASSDDHASFKSGTDLLQSNNEPWSISLCTLSRYHTSLYEKLREEQLVPKTLDAVLSTFPPQYPRYRQSQRLYTLNDTFIVDFGHYEWSLNIITEQGVEKLAFLRRFSEDRPTRITPYTGSALAQFERSTLPDHIGTRTVVLRFLNIITPVKCVIPLYDGYIAPPQEGELYRRTFRSFHHRVWSVNIDEPSMLNRGLQLLWDA